MIIFNIILCNNYYKKYIKTLKIIYKKNDR